MSLNGSPTLAEVKESEMLIKVSMTILKRSSKRCSRGEYYPWYCPNYNDITREAYHELFQEVVEVNVDKLRTIGERDGDIYLKKNQKI